MDAHPVKALPGIPNTLSPLLKLRGNELVTEMGPSLSATLGWHPWVNWGVPHVKGSSTTTFSMKGRGAFQIILKLHNPESCIMFQISPYLLWCGRWPRITRMKSKKQKLKNSGRGNPECLSSSFPLQAIRALHGHLGFSSLNEPHDQQGQASLQNGPLLLPIFDSPASE